MEGDWGGQVYLSCPICLVKCSEETLNLLLTDINDMAWSGSNGYRICYEVYDKQQKIIGGMEGGMIGESIWVHSQLKEYGITSDKIMRILNGEKKRLNEETI